MRSIRIAVSLSAFAILLGASPAEARSDRASGLALGFGADYLVHPEVGEFQVTLAMETPIVRSLTVGARFGVLITSDDVGAPIDFRLRIRTNRLYFDGLVGPWFIFDSGDTLRFHGAFGFGVLSGPVSFGAEVGALAGSGMVGLRLAFAL